MPWFSFQNRLNNVSHFFLLCKMHVWYYLLKYNQIFLQNGATVLVPKVILSFHRMIKADITSEGTIQVIDTFLHCQRTSANNTQIGASEEIHGFARPAID